LAKYIIFFMTAGASLDNVSTLGTVDLHLFREGSIPRQTMDTHLFLTYLCVSTADHGMVECNANFDRDALNFS